MRRTKTIAILAAMGAVLAIAPSTAAGKTVKFEGPIDLEYFPSPAGFATPRPAMELKIGFAGKKPKTVPAGTLKAEGMYGLCTPMSYGCNNYCDPVTGVCEAAHCPAVALEKFGDGIKIKNRRFSGTFRELEGDVPPDVLAQNFFKVTGRVGKRSVTGTVHARDYTPASSDPENPNPAATCDSGVLTWRASR
jgi:hypothetical protein